MRHRPWQAWRLQGWNQDRKEGTESALVSVEDLARLGEVEDFAGGVILEGI